jgi:histidinol-phosphatase (PHP family)
MGGEFTMSDDSHGIAQVGTNYGRGLSFLESVGVKTLWTFERQPHPGVAGSRATLTDKAVPIEGFRKHFKS